MKLELTVFSKRAVFTKLSVLVLSMLSGVRAEAAIVSLWEFNNSANLGQATIGTNLTIVGTAPTFSASQTYAGNTLSGVVNTSLGIGNHLLATHGIAANGGGARVNQYSMLFDFRRPTEAVWRTIFQTDTTNLSDGDYFVRDEDNRLGVGDLGYTTNYQMPADTWARLVITADLTATGAYRTYIDGVLVHTHLPTPLDGRFSFDPTVLLFADEDNENGLLSVGAVAMWDQALTANEVLTLGIAGASIVAVPEPSSLILVGAVGLGVMRLRRRKR